MLRCLSVCFESHQIRELSILVTVCSNSSFKHYFFLIALLILGAGGAIYVQCSHISQICSTILKSQLGFPRLLNSTETGSSREPKIRLVTNSARWFGSSIASGPAQLEIINYTVADIHYIEQTSSRFLLVPGQEKLGLNAWILDGLSQVFKGLEYTCRILICTSDAINCNEDSSLLPPQYISMDRGSGLFRVADISLVCPLDGGDVMVQISLFSIDSMLKRFSVTCAPCSAGQARTVSVNGRGWRCASCSPNQYVINPNHPSFGCKVYKLTLIITWCGYLIKRCLPAGLSQRSTLQWKLPQGPYRRF
jgi:hypothetical protein